MVLTKLAKQASKKLVVEVAGQTLWINGKKSGVYIPMLKRITGQLEAMLSHHAKVHILRFDFHQPTYTDTNERITTFNRRLFKWLKRNYGLQRIGFTWVREQEKAKQQHYHYALMIDGHKVQYSDLIQKKVIQIWSEITDGNTCWIPAHPYHNVARNDCDSLQEAVYRISYLAKARGKGYSPPQTKDYSTSRISKRIAIQF